MDDYKLGTLTAYEKKALLEKCPQAEFFYQLSGSQKEYFSGLTVNQPDEEVKKKSKVFLRVFYEQTENLFGEEIAQAATKQLANNLVVSTAEHLGMITHPECLNVLLNQLLYRTAHKEDFLITFSCATIKVSNELETRFCHLGKDKFSLFASKHQNTMAYLTPPWDAQVVIKNFENLLLKLRLRDEVKGILRSTFQDIMVSSQGKSFRNQICRFNHQLWDRIQPRTDADGRTIYIMLSLEEVVRDCLLIEFKRKERASWLYRLLTDPIFARQIQEALDGILCFWNTKNSQGTFLLWGKDGKGRPLKMKLKNGDLVEEKTGKKYNLNCGELVTALETGELIPAPSLCFLYLAFFVGVEVFGGLFQVLYLTEAKKRLSSSVGIFSSKDDLSVINNSYCNFYLNFETREASSGGLLRLVKPIDGELWREYQKALMIDEIQGCLKFILMSWK